MLHESIQRITSLRLSQYRFKYALCMVKLCDKVCRLNQQIQFISACIRHKVFPNSIMYLRLPSCLLEDHKAQLSIKNGVIRKLLRRLYSMRHSSNTMLEKCTDEARQVFPLCLFIQIQNICIDGQRLQECIQRNRLTNKLNWIISKQRNLPQVDHGPTREPKLMTNLVNGHINESTINLLSKGPNFSLNTRINPTTLLCFKSGFQRLIHQVRWWVHMQMNEQDKNNVPKLPLMKEFRNFSRPPTYPVTEDIINQTAGKFKDIVSKLAKMKQKSNLSQDEFRAGMVLREAQAELAAIPSDKGKDLCLMNKTDYENAVSTHLNCPVYRRMVKIDITKIVERVNKKWSEVAKSRSLPDSVARHYKTTQAVFPSMKGLIKTHKEDAIKKIRPVVNSINGPCFKITFLLYSILKPIESKMNYCITNSEELIEKLETTENSIFNEFPYPASLDVVDMYTNVPSTEAAKIAVDMAVHHGLNLYGLLPEDIMSLLNTILDNNFFVFNAQIFKQMTGLPMGSRISGLLANAYLHNMEKTIVHTLPMALYHRYVDDIFMVTRDEQTAEFIQNAFNNYDGPLKFELEKSNDGTINLLDFGVNICNNSAKISFYQKDARSDVVVNFKSNQPINMKRNFVKNEWSRIMRRCSSKKEINEQKKKLGFKLTANGYPGSLVKKWMRTVCRHPHSIRNNTDQVFYLSTPFINDGINRMIKKAVAPLGLNIRLVHKSNRLQSWLKTHQRNINKCSLANCKLKNNECNRRMVVYECICDCGANYIGSTIRALHIRIKEHHATQTSAIFGHKLVCQGNWKTKVIANGSDQTDLRLKEAILIDQLHPKLNRKEEVLPFLLVV